MPQLDKLTFISQLFWLISTFLVFYFIFLKYLLPKISIILKYRLKQLNYYNNQIKDLNLEQNNSVNLYENFLYEYLLNIKNLIAKSIDINNKWLAKEFLKINNKLFYVKYLLKDTDIKSINNLNKFSLFNRLLLNHIFYMNKFTLIINKIFKVNYDVFIKITNNLNNKQNIYSLFNNQMSNRVIIFLKISNIDLMTNLNKNYKLSQINHSLININSNFFNYISIIKKIYIFYTLKFHLNSNKNLLNLYKLKN